MISEEALQAIGEGERRSFSHDGFLIVRDLLTRPAIEALGRSFPRLFAGDFDTGIYPDEWHWKRRPPHRRA